MESDILEETLLNSVNNLRDNLKVLEESWRYFTEMIKKCENIKWNKGEVIAQSIITMRHIEDARMRYWKVIQYLWDWISIYDKKNKIVIGRSLNRILH